MPTTSDELHARYGDLLVEYAELLQEAGMPTVAFRVESSRSSARRLTVDDIEPRRRRDRPATGWAVGCAVVLDSPGGLAGAFLSVCALTRDGWLLAPFAETRRGLFGRRLEFVVSYDYWATAEAAWESAESVNRLVAEDFENRNRNRRYAAAVSRLVDDEGLIPYPH